MSDTLTMTEQEILDRILYRDAMMLVIDKPAGLPVDPPRDGSLSLDNHLRGLTFGFARWPVPIHRLDRDTSGCLLLARNPKAAARFTAAFAICFESASQFPLSEPK